MRNNNGHPAFVAPMLIIVYALGLAGWTWDWLEHLRWLHLGEKLAHLLMYLSGVLVIVALIPPLRQTGAYVLAYAWLVAGVALLLFVHPLAGIAALLPLPVRAAWVQTRRQLSPWFGLTAAGVALVLTGVAVDWFWHQANPGVHAGVNILLQPSHALQFAGWVVGFVGSGFFLLSRTNLTYHGKESAKGWL